PKYTFYFMTDEQEPIEPTEIPEDSPAKPIAKKAPKKSAKKAAKKVAKKAVKKTIKKAAKKSAKKATPKVEIEIEVEPEPELALEVEEIKVVAPIAEESAFAEAEAAELAAVQAAEVAVKAAEVARAAAEKAAKAAQEAQKKVTAKKAAIIEEEKAKEDQKDKGGDVPEGGIAVIEEAPAPREASREKEDEKLRPKKEPPPPPPPPEVPDEINLNEFRNQPLADLYDEVERLPVRIPNTVTRAHLVFTILSCYATHGTRIVGEGVVELSGGSFGMLRDEGRSFRGSPDDIYLSAQVLQDHGLREGQRIKVVVREPRHRDKFLSVDEVLVIDGSPAVDYVQPVHFDSLTSLFPEERFVLEGIDDGAGLATRVVDMVAPLGKGQRGLIVAPPRGGKTILLKQIAKALQINSPEAELVILLLDERPEEVTDFEEMVGQNVFASTFDEASKRHAEVANLVLERSRRLVEQGKDVVILLDSLTRLARGYNNAARGGPIGSGGISPKAITETRKFFGAARNVEEGGSLTILATCLVETESRMDDVIFEELKGTGNMEVRLDRELAEQRIYPAIHIPQSGTRNDDRLYHPEELPRVQEIRRHLASLPIGEAIETLLRNLARTKSNTELLLQGMR
ncbi:MAG: transcription termination factor Rho, partial [Akkermansiaceae bacterium]